MLTLGTLAPAVVAGIFVITVAIVTSRLTIASERRKFDDLELKKQKDT
jgi:hypothetical protein